MPPGAKNKTARARSSKGDDQHHTLQTYVHRLHQEVESLKLTRQLLMDRQLQRADDAGGSYEKTIKAYFSLYAEPSDDLPACVGGRDVITPRARRNADFFRSIMAVNLNEGHPYEGLENFIAQDRRYGGAFARNTLKVIEIKVHPIDKQPTSPDQIAVTGWCQYSSVIIPNTFELLFPHVKHDVALVQKMLGQHVSAVGRYDFVFDTTTNRIVQTHLDLNFVPVFMAMLRNPREVATLFSEAQISVDYVIGADQQHTSPKISEAMPTSYVNRISMVDLLT